MKYTQFFFYLLLLTKGFCTDSCLDPNADLYPHPSTKIPEKGYLLPRSLSDKTGPMYLFFMDFIFWTAKEPTGLIVVDGSWNFQDPASPSGPSDSSGDIIYPAWGFFPGFRIGLDVMPNFDGWDVFFIYTWFYNEKSSFPSLDSNEIALPAWPIVYYSPDVFLHLAKDNVQEVNDHWENHFNRFEWQIGREFFLSPIFAVRPYWGLLGWIGDQKFSILYKPVNFLEEDTVFQVHAKQFSWGVGPYAGSEVGIFFVSLAIVQMRFFARWGCGLPWSDFSAKVRIQEVSDDNTSAACVRNQSRHLIRDQQNSQNDYHQVTLETDISFGVRLEGWITKHVGMLVELVWDEQIWFDHMHMYSVYLQRQGVNGNYTMQGFTLRVGAYF